LLRTAAAPTKIWRHVVSRIRPLRWTSWTRRQCRLLARRSHPTVLTCKSTDTTSC